MGEMNWMGRTLSTATDSPPAVDDALVAAALRERFHRTMRWSLASVPGPMPSIYLILRGESDEGRIALWCLIAVASAAVQWAMYLRDDPRADWTRRANLAQFIGGCTWVLLPLIAMPREPVWQVLVAALLVAVTGWGVVFAGSIRSAYLAFVLPVGIGGTIVFALGADGDARFAAAIIGSVAIWFVPLGLLSHSVHREAATVTEQLRHQSSTDALTGIANRARVLDELDARLGARESDTPRREVVVAFLDLDGFKQVNDQFGHRAGDELLVSVARRLNAAISHDELVARLGGDEFTAIGWADAGEGERAARDLGERLVRCFDKQFLIHHTTVGIGCSAGTAIATDDVTAAALLDRADDALYSAKRRGGACVLAWCADSA